MKKSIFQAVESANKDGIAIEALIQAEHEFLLGDFDTEDIKEALGIDDDEFTGMCFKDDDGNWKTIY